MQEIETQHAILVTASAAGEDVRRDLLERGVLFGETTASLTQLRRALIRGGDELPILLCVTLDEPTLRRHGLALARLLDDRPAFTTPVHAIGLMIAHSESDRWLSIGCDAFARDIDHLLALIHCFESDGAEACQVGGRFAKQDREARLLSRCRTLDIRSDRTDRNIPLRDETRESDFRRPQP